MSGKLAVLFLVAVCLVQGNQARVVESRGLVDDITTTIKNILDRTVDNISQTTSELSDLATNLQDKVDNIISDQLSNVDQIIKSIQDRIQEAIDNIISLAGLDPESVKECVDTAGKSTSQLTDDTVAGFKACQKSAQDEVQVLVAELSELKNRNSQLVENTAVNVKKCIDENGINIIGEVRCLKGLLEQLKSDAAALIDQVKSTIKVGNDKLINVPLTLTKCISQVNNNIVQTELDIIGDLQQCVSSSSSSGESSAKPELTSAASEE